MDDVLVDARADQIRDLAIEWNLGFKALQVRRTKVRRVRGLPPMQPRHPSRDQIPLAYKAMRPDFFPERNLKKPRPDPREARIEPFARPAWFDEDLRQMTMGGV